MGYIGTGFGITMGDHGLVLGEWLKLVARHVKARVKYTLPELEKENFIIFNIEPDEYDDIGECNFRDKGDWFRTQVMNRIKESVEVAEESVDIVGVTLHIKLHKELRSNGMRRIKVKVSDDTNCDINYNEYRLTHKKLPLTYHCVNGCHFQICLLEVDLDDGWKDTTPERLEGLCRYYRALLKAGRIYPSSTLSLVSNCCS